MRSFTFPSLNLVLDLKKGVAKFWLGVHVGQFSKRNGAINEACQLPYRQNFDGSPLLKFFFNFGNFQSISNPKLIEIIQISFRTDTIIIFLSLQKM